MHKLMTTLHLKTPLLTLISAHYSPEITDTQLHYAIPRIIFRSLCNK